MGTALPAPPNMAADPYGESEGGGEQIACPDCGRKFNPGPFEKHVKICAKVLTNCYCNYNFANIEMHCKQALRGMAEQWFINANSLYPRTEVRFFQSKFSNLKFDYLQLSVVV